MSQTPQVDVKALWRYVVAQVKAQTATPGLWRAMEAGHPIALEEEELVIGYSGENSHQKGLLVDVRNRNLVEQILLAASRRKFRLRIIEGETLGDWEAVKAAEQEAARLQQQTAVQYRQESEGAATWDALGEQVIRSLTALPNRSLPSVQGRFMEEALAAVVEGYRRLMPAEPSEQDERNFSRALDRISERLGVPPAMLAYLVYQRLEG